MTLLMNIDQREAFIQSLQQTQQYDMALIANVIDAYGRKGNPDIAAGQKKYLLNQFEFFGLKAPARRAIQRPFLAKQNLPPKEILDSIIKKLWAEKERELHYFGMDLVARYSKKPDKKDIALYECMATHHSWWDTVDFIAVNLIGEYFRAYPEEINLYVDKWLDSGNMWLQRCAILFQLKYKEKLDVHLLSGTISPLLGSKEFFINKAIGWILREYSKTNPDWVTQYVDMTPLPNLSRKEALKHILKR